MASHLAVLKVLNVAEKWAGVRVGQMGDTMVGDLVDSLVECLVEEKAERMGVEMVASWVGLKAAWKAAKMALWTVLSWVGSLDEYWVVLKAVSWDGELVAERVCVLVERRVSLKAAGLAVSLDSW